MIVDNGKYYLYRHIRLDINEPFYIGTKKINELTGLPPNVVQSSNITFGPLPEKYVGQGLEDFDMETQQKYFGK